MDQRNHATVGLQLATDSGSLQATGPFVVNLCASVAPIELKSASLPGLERYRLYQVRRVEDNRPRYRLRLGFFADEAATEIALAAVREFYPAAFSVSAGSDDLKHAPAFDARILGGRQPQSDSRNVAATGRFERLPQSAAAARPVAPVAPPASLATAPVAPAIPVTPTPVAKAPVPRQVSTLELLPDTPPRAPAAPAPSFSTTPFRVQAADTAVMNKATPELQLQTDLPASIRQLTAGVTPVVTDGPVLIDSTQTLRMLTEAELSDSDAPLWFTVQLAVSDQPINLDTMPKLDIFSAFRLYSIAMTQKGKIQHSLRLGFFREAVSAEAVSGYLKTFFSSPDVLRVSSAEQTRFADPPAPPVLRETAGRSAQVIPLQDGRNRQMKPATAPVLSNGTPAPRQEQGKAAARAMTATPVKTSPLGPTGRADGQKSPVQAAPATAVAHKSSKAVGKRPMARNRSLNELLHEEAQQVALSESSIRRMEPKGSLLSRLVGKLTR